MRTSTSRTRSTCRTGGVDDVVRQHEAETAAVDRVLDGVTSMEEPSRASFRPTNIRWALTHLVEELARHLGHMDITRELLDGQTGR